MIYNTIIIGAGASGLMCASQIKGQVLVIDKNESAGNKILISGGKNCNFSNKNMSASHYFSSNPERINDILKAFIVADILDLLKKYNIKFEEREGGKYFAFGSKYILEILVSECEKNKTEFRFGTDILSVKKEEDLFIIDTGLESLQSKNLVIATGGKSYSHIGGSDWGLKIAKQFGFKITQNTPALVGLKYPNDLKGFASLSGISIPVNVKIKDKEFKDNLLFAHLGITGPAVLNASLYVDIDDELEIDFAPEKNLRAIPNRAYKIFQDYFRTSDKEQLQKAISKFKYKYNGTFGYDKAEVMRGGVSLSYLNKTLGSDKIKGIYFIGEVLDITGELGGYNLHMAFATGRLVANGINDSQ